jgi:hypothetical protein
MAIEITCRRGGDAVNASIKPTLEPPKTMSGDFKQSTIDCLGAVDTVSYRSQASKEFSQLLANF